MRNVQELFKMAGNIRLFIILTILRCPFDALRTIIQASFLQFAFSSINENDQSGLFYACVLFGIGSLLIFLYNGTVWTAYAAYVTRWVTAIRQKLFGRISCLSLQQVETRPSGEWITRLNADIQAAASLLNQPLHLPHAAVSAVSICVTAVILVLLEPKIFGLVLLFVVPHILINQLFIAKAMTSFAAKVQEATAENTTDMNAIVTCAETAAIYDARGFLLKRFEESSLQMRKANMKIHHRSAMGRGVIPLMGMGGYLAILIIGGTWVTAGTMTFGELTAVFQYRGSILAGTIMLISSLININTALAGAKRVNETMRIPLEGRNAK